MNALSCFIFLFAVGTGYASTAWLDFHHPKWKVRIRPKLRSWWQIVRPWVYDTLILSINFLIVAIYCVALSMLTTSKP